MPINPFEPPKDNTEPQRWWHVEYDPLIDRWALRAIYGVVFGGAAAALLGKLLGWWPGPE